MPYITQADRDQIDFRIAACPKGWASCYWLVKQTLNPRRYHQWAQAIAVFECAYLEACRRFNSEYEWSYNPFLRLPCDLPYSVKRLSEQISILFPQPDGALNYACSLLAEHPTDLLIAKEFMYDNDVGPYEDQAIERNGDLPRYAARPATEE
jgi:hypothetical protein